MEKWHFWWSIQKKNRLLARLNGIQNSNAYGYSSFLSELEATLKSEYNNWLRMEEEYWKLRSRIHWLNKGDFNSKFFHLSATNKRRINKIFFLKDLNGNWIDDPLKIMDHTYSYFQQVFTMNHDNSNLNSIKDDLLNPYPPWNKRCNFFLQAI